MGQLEQVTNEAFQTGGLGQDHPAGLDRFGDGPVDQSLGVAADGGHWCPKIVRDRKQELAFQTPGSLQSLSHGVYRRHQFGDLIWPPGL